MSAEKPVIGLLGIGEMGANVGRELVRAGFQVNCVLNGRSQESIERARDAGLSGSPDLVGLVAASDILFSILPPAAAEQEAALVAECLGAKPKALTFVEANAISPQLAEKIAGRFEKTQAVFVDGGIVGSPPGGGRKPRLYLSGANPQPVVEVGRAAFDIVALGRRIGAASGFKMIYASQTKGGNALLTAGLLAAERMGLLEAYVAELATSQPALLKRAETAVPRLPADAGRWTREMEEIRDTFQSLGLPGGFHQGAADIMTLLSQSPFGRETRRTRDKSRTMADTIRAVCLQTANDN